MQCALGLSAGRVLFLFTIIFAACVMWAPALAVAEEAPQAADASESTPEASRDAAPKDAAPKDAAPHTVAPRATAPPQSANSRDNNAESGRSLTEAQSVDGMVITATRLPTDPRQIGSTLTVVTEELMNLRQDRLLTEALQTVPGVDVRRSGALGSQTSIFMRGTDSDHTLLLLDGIKIHDVASPSGGAAIDHITLGGVQRLEVLRGPQSTLYGSDAIGGVVSAITRRGQGTPTFSLSTEAGSFDTFIQRVRSSGSTEKFHYSLSLMHIDSGGISNADGDAEHDPYRNTSMSSRFGVILSDQLEIDAVLHVFDTDTEVDLGANFDVSQTEARQIAGKIEPRLLLFDGVWEQKLSINYSSMDRETVGVNTIFFDQFPSRREGTIFEIDWQNNVYLNDQHTLTVGVDYEQYRAKFEDPGLARFSADSSDIALYVQDQIALGDRLFGTLGFRVGEHDQFGSHATYRVALAYHHLETGTIVRSSYGTGFKSPSLTELFDAGFGANNPDLDPEESRGFDIGIEQSLFDNRLTLGGTFFYNDVNDMIVNSIDDPILFTFKNINVEQVRAMGVEVFMSARPIDQLALRLAYTYTDTRAKQAASFGIADHARLMRRPLHKLSADITAYLWDERASVTLSALYVGERDDLDPVTFATVTAEDYFVMNLSGAIAVKKGVEIFGRIDNLLDEDYQDVLGFNTPGISAFAGVTITF